MVADAQPKTTAEAALVAQSVAVHLVTMRLAKQALNNGGMVMEREAALMGKLARTYTQQMEHCRGCEARPAPRGRRSRSQRSCISMCTTTGGTKKTPDNPMQRTEPASLKSAPRCQARKKRGGSCRSPAVRGKRVCRMHGGRAGAPKGKANGNYRHGGETREAVALRRAAMRLLKQLRQGGPDS